MHIKETDIYMSKCRDIVLATGGRCEVKRQKLNHHRYTESPHPHPCILVPKDNQDRQTLFSTLYTNYCRSAIYYVEMSESYTVI